MANPLSVADQAFLAAAIELSQRALEDQGKTPFGAILVIGGDVVSEGTSSVVELRDPTDRYGTKLGSRFVGANICVGASVDRIEHGQSGVVYRPGGVVDCICSVGFGEVGVGRGGIGIHLPVPLLHPSLDVAHLVGRVSSHLVPLAGGPGGSPLRFFGASVRGDLRLIDSLPSLVT
jgi:hypothetical protein